MQSNMSHKRTESLGICEVLSLSVGGNLRSLKASEHANFHFNI